MPVLRPYGDRNAHLGKRTHLDYENTKNYEFENCEVAQFILENNPKLRPDKIVFKNGTLTELGKHAVNCDKCKSPRLFLLESGNQSSIEMVESVEYTNRILDALDKWRKKNAPTQDLEQCVYLMAKEIEFWRNEDKLRKAGKL